MRKGNTFGSLILVEFLFNFIQNLHQFIQSIRIQSKFILSRARQLKTIAAVLKEKITMF